MKLNIGDTGSVIATHNGCKVKQHFNQKAGRFYVWLPKHSGLRERFGDRDRMLRSHFVYLMTSGLNEIPFGYVLHHIDHNRLADHYENLELMTASDHDRLHRNEPSGGNFLGKSHAEGTIKKMRDKAIKRGNNGIWENNKDSHSESTKKIMSEKSSGKNNPMHRGDLNDSEVREFYKGCGNITRTAAKFGCSTTAVRNRISGVEPVRKIPNSKKAKSLKEIVCYAALNGLVMCAERYDLSEGEVVAKIIKYRGTK